MSIDTRGVFAMSDGHRHFKLRPAPRDAQRAMAAQFIDYDNDGLLDLLAVTTRGARLWRNVGSDFVDVTDRALPFAFQNLDATFGFPAMLSIHVALPSPALPGTRDATLL